ncbi:MAG: hypothetical protein WKF84_07610 [Pyrinomonadaceae bacterium]
MAEGTPHIVAFNKSDLPNFSLKRFTGYSDCEAVAISAYTGYGFAKLRESILAPFQTPGILKSDLMVTNARQHDFLRRAGQALTASVQLRLRQRRVRLVLVGLYDALKYLGQVSGETTTEDVLTEIFSTFCIGK